jgi:NosR/NirI family nitrous oxide reductase transcriptional regulator
MIDIKKTMIIFGMLLLSIGGITRQATACQLTITPANFVVTPGEQVEFQVERTQTCGRCLLPLEDTNINISGGALIGDPQWQDGNGHPDLIRFKAQFNQTGPVKVVIERSCAKNHTMIAATGTVQPVVAKTEPVQSRGNTLNSVKPAVPSVAAVANKPEPSRPAQPTLGSAPTQPVVTPVAPLPAAVNPSAPGPDAAHINDESIPQPSNAAVQTTHFDRKQSAVSFTYLYPWLLLMPVGLGLFLFKKTWLRRTLLVLSMVGIGFYSGGCPCPVGSVFNYLTPNPPSLLIFIILIMIPLLTTLIWGRFFCGWVCPLGAVQELIHAKSRKPGTKFFQIDRLLKYLKFVVLISVIYLTLQTGRNLFCQFEPFKMLFSFHGDLVTGVILGVILLTAIIIKRPFCRYLCPFGAILALVARFTVFKIKPSPASCSGCGVCAKDRCPMDAIAIDAVNKIPVIDHTECIQCGNCVESCRRQALSAGFKFKTAKNDKYPTPPVISS